MLPVLKPNYLVLVQINWLYEMQIVKKYSCVSFLLLKYLLRLQLFNKSNIVLPYFELKEFSTILKKLHRKKYGTNFLVSSLYLFFCFCSCNIMSLVMTLEKDLAKTRWFIQNVF